jgi:hypothetical protein
MKGQMLKLFVIVTVCLSIVAGCVASPAPAPMQPTTTPVPPTPTPLDVVQKYQDAYARHDMDAAMSLFTDDAKYAWGEYFTTTDRTMIRNWLEYDAALNVQTTVNNCRPTDSTVTCEWRFVNDCFGANGTGSNDMNGVIVFTVREGMISAFLYTDNPNPAEGQWEEAFFTWLAATYPTEPVLETLAAKKFDRNFGQHLDKLCKEYWEGKKPATTSTLDPAAPVKAWVDALNSGDVDAALAPFTDDVTFAVFEYNASNKDGLRGIFDWLAGLETKYQIMECQPKEDRVVCTMPVSDACIAGYDPVDGLKTTMTFAPTQDGKIAQVNGYLDGFDDYYAKWISPAMTWMRANRAEELAKAESTSDGREAGAINAKLCKEYAESLKVTPIPTPAAAADPLPIIKAYQDAANRGDVDAAVAFFADQAIVMMLGGAVGRDEIRGVEEWQTGLNHRLEFTDCKTAGNTVTCKGFLTDDCAKAVGGLGVRFDEVTFTIHDGKIQKVYGSASDVDSTRNDENGSLMIAWAQSNRPEDYAKSINPTTAGHLTRQNGQLFLRMCLQAAKDPSFLVELWGAAFNRDDLDGAMGLFVDNGLSFAMGEISGDNQVARDTLEYIKGFNGKFVIKDCKTKGQQVVCALALVDDYCVKAEGLKAVNYQTTFKFKDNRIQTLGAKMAAADALAVSAFGDKLGAWATANRPEDWKKYQDPAAVGITPRQNGELIATMCKDYLDSQK